MGKTRRRLLEKLTLELEVRDKNGKLIKKHRQVMGGWVKNWMSFMRAIYRCQFVTGTVPTDEVIKDTGGAERTIFSTSSTYVYVFHSFRAPTGIDTYGIQTGIGITPVAPTDYTLAGKITHGTGAGQLQYGEITIDSVIVSDNKSSVKVIRTFSNGSGATITVKEIGIVYTGFDSGAIQRFFLIARDVLTTPIDVPIGSTLTVRYIHDVFA